MDPHRRTYAEPVGPMQHIDVHIKSPNFQNQNSIHRMFYNFIKVMFMVKDAHAYITYMFVFYIIVLVRMNMFCKP